MPNYLIEVTSTRATPATPATSHALLSDPYRKLDPGSFAAYLPPRTSSCHLISCYLMVHNSYKQHSSWPLTEWPTPRPIELTMTAFHYTNVCVERGNAINFLIVASWSFGNVGVGLRNHQGIASYINDRSNGYGVPWTLESQRDALQMMEYRRRLHNTWLTLQSPKILFQNSKMRNFNLNALYFY